MSTDSNPYSPSEFSGIEAKPTDGYGVNDAISVVMPLHRAKFWLKLLGICNIVIGAIYCVTIVGAIVGWLPLWLGILLNKAATNLEMGVRNNSPGPIYQAMTNLGTVFTIVGVLCIIQLAIIALYIIAAVVVAVVVGVGAASGAGAN